MALHFDRTLEAVYGVPVPLSSRVTRLVAPNPGPFTFQGTGVHVIGAGASVAVIDPGPDIPAHIAALKQAIGARRVSHILITHTHRDHSPAAAALKAWSGAKTFAAGPHGDTEGEVEEGADRDFVPDAVVRDGDVLAGDGFTLSCVATPGHAANHMCYALAEEQALFCGDHVMGWSTSVVAPPDGDMAAYLASLRRLIVRGDAIAYPTHGGPIREPAAFMTALLEHRLAREREVMAAKARGLTDVAALVEAIYPALAPGLRPAAALTVMAHLQKLERCGPG